jgi:hypothetical protein
MSLTETRCGHGTWMEVTWLDAGPYSMEQVLSRSLYLIMFTYFQFLPTRTC